MDYVFKQIALCCHLLFYYLRSVSITHGVADVVCLARCGYGIVHGEGDDVVVAYLTFLRQHTVVGVQAQVLYVYSAVHGACRLIEVEHFLYGNGDG